MRSERVQFPGSLGMLSARLDLPDEAPTAFAIYGHCFTCGKNLTIASQISSGLAERGIGVLRFDFAGIGQSEGNFADSNFSTNLDDLMHAATWLEANFSPPTLLIGHSFGGAAVLAVVSRMPSVKAVATIAAPSEPKHVLKHFPNIREEVAANGEANITVGGVNLVLRQQFIDDVDSYSLADAIANLDRPLMIFHSPIDETVGIENAGQIFAAAKHPKSFVSLDKADHLLRGKEHADFVATVLSAWACRYL